MNDVTEMVVDEVRPTTRQPVSFQRVATWLCVIALTCLNLLLSLHDLSRRSLWLDESVSWFNASQHLQAIFSLPNPTGNMSGYFALLHFSMEFSGSSVDAMRLPSCLFGAAVVPMIYLVGRRVGGERTGLFASALISASLPLILWNQNARGYSMGAFLATASTFVFMRAVQAKRTMFFAIWIIVSVVLCYTLTLGWLVVLAQLVSLAFLPSEARPWKRVLTSLGAMVILLVPLGYWVVKDGDSSEKFVPPVGVDEVRSIGLFLLGQTDSRRSVGALIFAILWLGVVGIGVRTLFRRGRNELTWMVGLITCWLIVPLPVLVFEGLVYQSVLVDRYFLMSVPAGAVLAAFALSRLPLLLSSVLLLAILASQLSELPFQDAQAPGDFRDATSYIVSNEKSRDCVTFSVSSNDMTYAYYLGHDHLRTLDATPRMILPPLKTTANAVYLNTQLNDIPARFLNPTKAVVAAEIRRCDRLWFVVWGAVAFNPQNGILGTGGVADFNTLYAHRSMRDFDTVLVYLYSK
jgi:hypothetical protein